MEKFFFFSIFFSLGNDRLNIVVPVLSNWKRRRRETKCIFILIFQITLSIFPILYVCHSIFYQASRCLHLYIWKALGFWECFFFCQTDGKRNGVGEENVWYKWIFILLVNSIESHALKIENHKPEPVTNRFDNRRFYRKYGNMGWKWVSQCNSILNSLMKIDFNRIFWN